MAICVDWCRHGHRVLHWCVSEQPPHSRLADVQNVSRSAERKLARAHPASDGRPQTPNLRALHDQWSGDALPLSAGPLHACVHAAAQHLELELRQAREEVQEQTAEWRGGVKPFGQGARRPVDVLRVHLLPLSAAEVLQGEQLRFWDLLAVN